MPEALVGTLERYGLVTAFPIQSATIADALAGKDVLGKARTGSGKTLGFGLPMLSRLATMGRPAPHRPFGIVLVPTRELAMQVGDALEPYAHAMDLSIRLIAGGLSMSKQIMALERGVHLVVATPGRLADLMRRGHAILDQVAISVLDEADHMAEMGFAEEIAEILSHTPEDGQRLLFSATLDGVVDDLVSRFMHSPVLHDVTSGSDAPTQRHVVLAIPPHEKYQTATRIAAREGRTICFVRTKLAADRVAAEMREAGVLAVALHGDRSQYERNLAMTEFRAGRLPVLVATDVAARGIHVDAVDVVLQIDPPADYRDYTHRSGRTGRAGADGLAVMMVLPHQRGQARRILDNAGIKAEEAVFRVIDAAALAEIDELTGGKAPSGVPVAEPVGPPRTNRFGRPERPQRGPRGGDDRGPRRDRGFDDSRPARRDRPFDDRLVRRDRFDAPRDSVIAEREAALSAREREIAAREAAIAEREAALAAASQRTSHDAERPARDFDRPKRQGERPARDNDRWQRDGAGDRGERADRGARPDRAQRGDRASSYGDARPARRAEGTSGGGYQGRSERSASDRFSSDRFSSDRPRTVRTGADRAGSERRSGDRPFGDRPSGERSGSGRSYSDRGPASGDAGQREWSADAPRKPRTPKKAGTKKGAPLPNKDKGKPKPKGQRKPK